jgi:hypothetical protein
MQCGQQLPDVARFCMKCGSEVPSVTSNQKGEKPSPKNSTPFTPQREDEINRALLGVIADSLENGSLKQSDRNPIADFWESKADSIKTEDDLLSLLSDLAKKWPVFYPLYELEQSGLKQRIQNAHPEVLKRFLDRLTKGR